MKFSLNAAAFSSRRFHVLGFLALSVFIAAGLLLGRPLWLTGDEPRYVMYAVSLLRNGQFVMSLPEWQSFYQAATGLAATGLPVGGGDAVLMHGVYLPALLSPIGAVSGLAGLRFVTLLAGLAGLYCLLQMNRRIGSPGAALMATSVAGVSLPLLPYLHLFYMEAYLFALVAFVWNRLQRTDRSCAGDVLTAVFILSIPFVHMRGAVVAVALYGMLLWDLWGQAKRARAVGLAVLAVAALALLIGFNLAIYGVVTGPVNSARPPMPWEWFDVVSMQLFNVRHGLIAYGPVWLLGYAGLVAGAVRGERIARQGLVLACIAGVTGMGVNPGECWPARFWVLSVPMLSVGLCITWRMGRSWLMRSVTVALVVLTLVNTWLFLNVPNMFLENRQTTATYQRFFDKIGFIDPGLMLPGEIVDAADIGAARNLAIGAALFILFVWLALRTRRSGAAVPAALLVLAALDLMRVGVVPKPDYAVSRTDQGYTLALATDVRAGYVQTGHYWETWYTAPDFPRFMVETSGEKGRVMQDLAANQVISTSCGGAIHSIAVAASSGSNFDSALKARFVLYRSRSLLRNGVSMLRGDC